MDFRKKLRTRLYWALGYAAVGLAMVVTGFLTKTENDFVQMYGIALFVAGIARLVQYFVTARDEESVRRREIAETDERNIMIAQRARSLTFSVYIILSGAAVCVLSLLGMSEAATMIAWSICALVFIYWVCCLIVRKMS